MWSRPSNATESSCSLTSSPPDQADRLEAAVDSVYDEERCAGRLDDNDSLHLLGALGRQPLLAELVDMPPVLSVVASALGCNVYAYHTHLDVYPPVVAPDHRWRWHQDGCRQNLDLVTEPNRPRLSVKVAWFLSDVSQPDRGNLTILRGSNASASLARPRADEPPIAPAGAEPLLATRGSAAIFDRRLWHARSENVSSLTRKVVFIAYTYRWIRPRETFGLNGQGESISPLRRLLCAAGVDDGVWLVSEAELPLRRWLAEQEQATAAGRVA